MRKRTLTAIAKSAKVIELYVNKEFCSTPLKNFALYVDGKKDRIILPVSNSESHSSKIYTFLFKDILFIPGRKYEILTEQNYFVPVDISFLGSQSDFEEKYRYDGKLGAEYHKDHTMFRVFSPFSHKMILLLRRNGAKDDELECHRMTRLTSGVFEVSVEGDLDSAMYLFQAEIFSETIEVVDPYAYSLDSNSRHGYVIDPEKVHAISFNSERLPLIDDPTKAIVYECNVRDMTSLSGISGSGTYDAFLKGGMKTKDGFPLGLDYLTSLGVTHIQLQPVMDFQSINDDDPKGTYNWGYDPMFYFAPEGSYSKNPNDPYSRVLGLRKLVSELHGKGLRVVLDVVYNHVYSSVYNSIGLLCPNYCYRLNADFSLSNGTGCGNDLETRNHMVRKLIVDSLLHIIDFYDVDGFRFDLMGVIDIDTINEAKEKLRAIKPDIMLYGEGWDLWTNLPGDKKASLYNSFKMPDIGFFNDRFRDIAKGKSNETELAVKGYLLGDYNYIDGFKHVMLGSSIPLAFAPLFSSHRQSVNFVECHDNNTLYDKIKATDENIEETEIQKRIKMLSLSVLFASGIPFFHEGQEIGHSKKGIANSYNSGDEINGFDYSLLSKNKDLYLYFIDAVRMKKEFIELAGDYYHDLPLHMTFENLQSGALKINYDLPDHSVFLIFNPGKTSVMVDFNDYVRLVFSETGKVDEQEFFSRLGIIPAISSAIYIKKKANASADKERKDA